MKLFKALLGNANCEAPPQAHTPEGSVHSGASTPRSGAASVSKGQKTELGVCVGDSTSLPDGGRLQAKIGGRYVTVLRIEGKLSCIDSICFHAGGPLGLGDIEDLDGKKCLVCPWHFYKIDVCTGDKYYQGMEFKDGKLVGGEWKSNGVRQRTHEVVEADGKIYVKVASGSATERVDSDGYAFDASCGERILNAPPSALRQRTGNVGADGRKPSGQVLRGQYHS
ncbi:hypothetical protein HYH03_013293 [Edaphochlamys debaryana]|uniref:Rieske domain-containing protein n=1 Tax=Edaphochlamys debaryana TaxID=47281 RepID=A0A835XWJ9_9CHLO|nr:hypothetical protein HYH03_013293 [Edaphochlamys debaryana]|eukprot:KAG2488150.1 hypothetical protein HYH03_013293 [Edaphochlamys debaryana]